MALYPISSGKQIQLCPSQQAAFDGLLQLIPKSQVVALLGDHGYGRSVILRQLQTHLGATYIDLADIFEQAKLLHPLQLEESLEKALRLAFDKADYIICDDFHLIRNQMGSGCYTRARPEIFSFALTSLLNQLRKEGKHLILGDEDQWIGAPFESYSLNVSLSSFTATDIAFLFQQMSGLPLSNIDFENVQRYVPNLNAHQIAKACISLQEADYVDTDHFIRFLETNALTSNVNKEEVTQVSLDDLYGIEEVRKQLDIHLIYPLERDDLVAQFDIQPKRGVLLYGPPGTGKTTIGRALAHKLGSKFFLIDGTVISGTQHFYYKIENIFRKAKENAPSILFIDDCDLLFENAAETGLYRYLLTMLDGLESKSNEQVTIMLTAMNIGSLPPALIRSGRVELWLETRLPDLAARQLIIEKQLKGKYLQLTTVELADFASLMEGLTGSDIQRVMTDARNLHGYETAQGLSKKDAFKYFKDAFLQLQKQRQQLAEAPAFTAAHRPGNGQVLNSLGRE